jgi:hypothetical protein
MASDDITGDYDNLEELSESDFEIVDGQPDILGWDVRDGKGNKVGEVHELMFNADTRKVRYIVLDMENNDVDLEEGRVLIPIGVAELDEKDDNVMLPNVSAAQILALPLYERGRVINAETDEEIRRAFARDEDGNVPGTNVYDHFNETKFYSKKRQPPANEDSADL